MLKALFSSQTRVKLLKTFILNPDEEFFVRQLTRLLDEQINSIRRELENLKKIWLIRSRSRNRKKYFHVNTSFLIYSELKNIFIKTSSDDKNMKKDLSKLWDCELAIISGKFVNDPKSDIDLLMVWNIVSKKVEDYIEKDLGKRNIKFSVLTEDDFNYRLEVKDSFILKILNNKNNIFLINKMKNTLDKYIKD